MCLFYSRKIICSGVMSLVAIGLGQMACSDVAPCETPLISVESNDQELHERVCKTIASALPALEKCHLGVKNQISIHFFDSLDTNYEDCLGLYHTGMNQINLLTPESFNETIEISDSWNAIPASEHYDSIVVHELAHALSEQSSPLSETCSADREYIAYAMQLSTLSEPSREAFMASVGISSTGSAGSINGIILGFSPPVFAANVWLHFSQTENGCDFVGKLLRGEKTFWMAPL